MSQDAEPAAKNSILDMLQGWEDYYRSITTEENAVLVDPVTLFAFAIADDGITLSSAPNMDRPPATYSFRYAMTAHLANIRQGRLTKVMYSVEWVILVRQKLIADSEKSNQPKRGFFSRLFS